MYSIALPDIIVNAPSNSSCSSSKHLLFDPTTTTMQQYNTTGQVKPVRSAPIGDALFPRQPGRLRISTCDGPNDVKRRCLLVNRSKMPWLQHTPSRVSVDSFTTSLAFPRDIAVINTQISVHIFFICPTYGSHWRIRILSITFACRLLHYVFTCFIDLTKTFVADLLNVTQILLDRGLPSFSTVTFNSAVIFNRSWCDGKNDLWSKLVLYCL